MNSHKKTIFWGLNKYPTRRLCTLVRWWFWWKGGGGGGYERNGVVSLTTLTLTLKLSACSQAKKESEPLQGKEPRRLPENPNKTVSQLLPLYKNKKLQLDKRSRIRCDIHSHPLATVFHRISPMELKSQAYFWQCAPFTTVFVGLFCTSILTSTWRWGRGNLLSNLAIPCPLTDLWSRLTVV